jgi:hypothetical protein
MFKQLGASAVFKLEDELAIPSAVTFAPLAIAPIASPFGQRRKPSFPLLGKRPTVEQQGIVPDYEEDDDGDDFEKVTIEDLPEDLDSILGGAGKKGSVDIFGKSYQIGPKGTRSTFGVPQVFEPGRVLGQVASLSGTTITAAMAGQKNLNQLQYAQAMAGLGVKGYGVGIVNNQVVGVTPSNIIGTLPNASPKDMQKIRDTLTGKSGPMKAGIETFKSLTPQTPVTSAMRQFQKEIIESKLSDNLKSEILGLGTALNVDFGVDTFKGKLSPQKLTDPKTFMKDYKEATNLGTGDEKDDEVDEQTYSDFTAPDLTTTPPSDYFSSMPTGGFFSDSDDSYDSGTGDPSGGFGGSSEGDYGFTAYGGRIGMYNGGFTSNTKTVKGVGLIKPEQTFMDTDVVDDDIELTAENGDFIINGPASKQREKEIKFLVDYGIDELRKEGVDIRVGNPKIDNKNKVPLIVASSETYIPRVIAEKIGYPILDALNNTGKSEVARLKRKLDNEPTDKGKYQASEGTRVEDTNTGSFLTMEEANRALGIKPEPLDPKTLKSFKFYLKKKKPQRGDVEKLLDNISDTDKLALLIATETISTKDPLETLESVGQVVMNRINDKQFDFKNVNTLDEVLKQRSYRGEGSKMFQFDGLEPTSVKNRINEFLNKGGIKGYRKALTAAENVLTKGGGEPDYMTERMPFNVLFYDKAGSPKSISRRYDKDGKDIGPNELIDEYGKVGDHTFYTSHMTKEYP